jgi:glycosyltransferase involved in cell wall biosynthesis
MHVLMIGIGTQVLTDKGGNAKKRHLEYARRAGKLTMVISSFSRERLEPSRLSGQLMVYPTNSLSKLLFPWNAYKICARICRSESIDLIVTQDPFATGLVGYFLKRRFLIPLLIGSHSYFINNRYWISERPIRNRMFNAVGKALIKKADALRVVNLAEKQTYLSLGLASERIRVLPTPVATAKFSAAVPCDHLESIRNRLHLQGKRVLLWVGDPHQSVKDLGTLFKSLQLLIGSHPDVMLLLAGDFTYSAHCLRLAEALGISKNMITLGRIPHEELPAYYQLCEFYVHSSCYEGLAKVMVEAASSGKAIVSTNVSGIEAIVKDGATGSLSPIGDFRLLARNMQDLLDDPEKAKRMGKSAREFVLSQFDEELMIDGIVEFWKLFEPQGHITAALPNI